MIITQPLLTALDAAGNPLSGAKLYTYEAGTTTPQAVYQDAALTQPHTNPVVADSAGRFPAMYADGAIKLDLRTSADVAVRVTDNVNLSTQDSAYAIDGGVGRTTRARFGDTVRLADQGQSVAGLQAALGLVKVDGRILDGQLLPVEITGDGFRTTLTDGQTLDIRDLMLLSPSLLSTLTIGTGFSAAAAMAIVAVDASGRDMWHADYSYKTTAVDADLPARGDYVVEVTDVSLFQTGDHIVLHSASSVYDAEGVTLSESARVVGVTGSSGQGTLKIDRALRFNYPSGTTVRRWVRATVKIDARIDGGGVAGQNGVCIYGCKVFSRRLEANSLPMRQWMLVHCISTVLSAGLSQGSQTGFGYGIVAAGAGYLDVGNITASYLRHAITTGAGPGVDKVMMDLLKVNEINAYGCTSGGVDAHPGVYQGIINNVLIEGRYDVADLGDNTADGDGIVWQGRHLTVHGGRIKHGRRHGIVVQPYGAILGGDDGGQVIIIGPVHIELQGQPDPSAPTPANPAGILISDDACTGTAADGTAKIASVQIIGARLDSFSGSQIQMQNSICEQVQMTGTSVVSRGNGHGMRLLSTTSGSSAGSITRAQISGCSFEAPATSGLAALYFTGRSGAMMNVEMAATQAIGGQWGFRAAYAVVKDAANDATGFTTSAKVTDSGTGAEFVASDAIARYYTSSATWTRPGGVRWVEVHTCGAGGGGGGGPREASGTATQGGGGGGAGSYRRQIFRFDDLPSSVSITIGAGGTGGAGATVDGTAGTDGSAGGQTTFGSLLAGFGGGGGGGDGGGGAGAGMGNAASASGATAGAANATTQTVAGGTTAGGVANAAGGGSGAGGGALAGGAGFVGGTGVSGGGGGGGGAGLPTSGVSQGGEGRGGRGAFGAANTNGATTAAATNGAAGVAGLAGLPGSGGAGGGSNGSGSGGNGGAGGLGGGGGGGGGAGSGGNGGAGGAGGAGHCLVIEYY